MNTDEWRHKLNENGTTAWIRVHNNYDDSNQYAVYLEFSDPALNYDGEAWDAGYFNWIRNMTSEQFSEKAIEIGTQLYDFLMNFRTSYGNEATINEWRKKYEDQFAEARIEIARRQDAEERLSAALKEIASLRTDRVKELEAKIAEYQSIVKIANGHADKLRNVLSKGT